MSVHISTNLTEWDGMPEWPAGDPWRFFKQFPALTHLPGQAPHMIQARKWDHIFGKVYVMNTSNIFSMSPRCDLKRVINVSMVGFGSLNGWVGDIWSPNWQYIPLIYHLYITNWVIICYLPTTYLSGNQEILHWAFFTSDHQYDRMTEFWYDVTKDVKHWTGGSQAGIVLVIVRFIKKFCVIPCEHCGWYQIM